MIAKINWTYASLKPGFARAAFENRYFYIVRDKTNPQDVEVIAAKAGCRVLGYPIRPYAGERNFCRFFCQYPAPSAQEK
jgi:hypothetical protein